MSVLNVSAKGAIVIPSPLRKKYKIKPSTKVEIVDTEEGLLIVPIPENVIDYLYGCLKDEKFLLQDLKEEKEKEKILEEKKWKDLF